MLWRIVGSNPAGPIRLEINDVPSKYAGVAVNNAISSSLVSSRLYLSLVQSSPRKLACPGPTS